jgi:hypothetical protein
MKILPLITGLLTSLLVTGRSAEPALTPNPAAAGLWVGEVTLREVTHAAGGTNAPTADQAQVRVILHVDSSGAVRLLKDVTIAQKTGAVSANALILVTNPSLLPGVSGVVRRAGKLVGRRIATAAYDFDGNEFALTGGIGQNRRTEGTFVLRANHPTNPFRHAYHPDHATGFEITRKIALNFAQPVSNVNGVDLLAGTYEETVTGLHKTTLVAKGTVALHRISTVPALNQ